MRTKIGSWSAWPELADTTTIDMDKRRPRVSSGFSAAKIEPHLAGRRSPSMLHARSVTLSALPATIGVRPSSRVAGAASVLAARSSPRHVAAPHIRRCHTTSGLLRSEEHTSELQSRLHLVCRLLLEKKKKNKLNNIIFKIRKKKDKSNITNIIS